MKSSWRSRMRRRPPSPARRHWRTGPDRAHAAAAPGSPAGRSPPARPRSRRRSARRRDGRPRSAPADRRRTAPPRPRPRAARRCPRPAPRSSSRACCTTAGAARSMRIEPLDRGRHDVGHDARALAAAEHEQPERARRLRRGDRASPPPRSPPAAPGCRCASPWRRASARASSTPAKLVAIALTRAREQPVGAPHHRVLLVDERRDLAQRRRQHRRHGRIAAEADDRGRLDAPEQAQAPAACRARASPPCARARADCGRARSRSAMTWIRRAGNVLP